MYPDMFQKANVFVSHAWRYEFLADLVAAVGSWIETQASISTVDWFLWIDIFVVNQYLEAPEIANHSEEEARNFEAFADGFQSALKDVG